MVKRNYSYEKDTSWAEFFFGDYKVPAIPKRELTRPSRWARGLVCINNCEICPLAQRGCAMECTRFNEDICPGCPCTAHDMAKKQTLSYDESVDIEKDGYDGDIKDYSNSRGHRIATPLETRNKIKKLYKTGDYVYDDLAKKFGVSIATVSNIINNKIK